MVKRRMLTVLAAMLVAWTASSTAPVTSASAPAKIRIIGQIGIAKMTDMDFGVIVIASTAASVTLAPLSGRVEPAVSGNAMVLSSSTPTAAKMTVTGYENSSFVITVPTSVTLSDIGGNSGSDMSVSLSCDQTGTAPTFTSALIGGTKDFYLGGTLNIGVNQTPSTYQGTFNVNVNYN